MIIALLILTSSAEATALCHLIKDRDTRLRCKAVESRKPSLCSLVSDVIKRQECKATYQLEEIGSPLSRGGGGIEG